MLYSCVKLLFLLLMIGVVMVYGFDGDRYFRKRSASSDDNMEQAESSLDRLNVKYDEYPMVVPKRAAILLDRILVALHHALEDGDQEGARRISKLYKGSRNIPSGSSGGGIGGGVGGGGGSGNTDGGGGIIGVGTFRSGNSIGMVGRKIGKDLTAKFIPNSDSNEDMYNDLPIDLDERDLQQSSQSDDTRGLQRRGHGEGFPNSNKAGRVYWRCYFNAVTCF